MLDAILRRDLSEILREAVDKAVFQGSGASNEPSGFAALLTGGRTSALTAKASFSALLAQAVMLMESAKLSDVGQVRIAGNPILFQTLADDLDFNRCFGIGPDQGCRVHPDFLATGQRPPCA